MARYTRLSWLNIAVLSAWIKLWRRIDELLYATR